MNCIQLFTNQLFGNVRSIIINGEPWFVGKDVCDCLGYVRSRDAIADHVDPEDKILPGDGGRETPPPPITFTDSLGRQQTQYPVWINESGLYSLIFSSKLPAAKTFKHWITSQVLPTMRKIGFDRSMELLQNEVNYLRQVNGELHLSNIVARTDNEYLQHFIITNPNISIEDKIKSFSYDPSSVNPDIDLHQDIQNFKDNYL